MSTIDDLDLESYFNESEGSDQEAQLEAAEEEKMNTEAVVETATLVQEEQAEEVVSESLEEMAQETTEAPVEEKHEKRYTLKNYNIIEYCNKLGVDDLKTVNISEKLENTPLNALQTMLLIRDQENKNAYDMGVMSLENRVPYLELEKSTVKIRNLEKGIWIEQRNDTFGMCCYVPFIHAKKYYGFFHLENGLRVFSYYDGIGSRKDITFPEMSEIGKRNLQEEINEKDIIKCSAKSVRFEKLIKRKTYVVDFVSELNRTMDVMIDPAYLYKIMGTINELAYPVEASK